MLRVAAAVLSMLGVCGLCGLSGCGSSPAPSKLPAQAPKLSQEPDVCTDLSSCTVRCHAGDAAGCAKAADAMLAHPAAVQLADYQAMLDRACSGGVATACRQLAALLVGSPALPIDRVAADALYRRACVLGDPGSCLNSYPPSEVEPKGADPEAPLPPEIERALALFEQQCKDGRGEVCIALSGIFHVLRRGAGPESAEATAARGRQLLESACLSGDADACLQGTLFIASMQLGQGTTANRLAKRGCELGNHECCLTLAESSLEMADSERLRLLEGACDADLPSACLSLGQALSTRDNHALQTKAAAALSKAVLISAARCNMADSLACSVLAKALPWAAPSAADDPRYVQMLQTTCERNNALVCSDLADAMRQAPRLGTPAESAELKAKACSTGYPFACSDPMAALGYVQRIHAPVLDERSNLVWADLTIRDVAPTTADTICTQLDEGGHRTWRLPTRVELSTFLQGTKVRPFAYHSLPHNARLWSSEMSGPDARWALDLQSGAIAQHRVADGYARCVRAPTAGDRKGHPTLRLSVRDEHLEYAIRSPSGKVLTAATITKAASAPHWAGTLDTSVTADPVVVEVSPETEWSLVSRFLNRATEQGLRIGIVVLMPAP